jgi:very-short-patch-repair endonuclease
MLHYNKELKPLSQHLRRNMTEAEKLLWSKLRLKQLKGYQFYRQKIIDRYIADFYCPQAMLVIELNGGQHYSESGKEKDELRDKEMDKNGLKVLRFSDKEVFGNINAVIQRIWENL